MVEYSAAIAETVLIRCKSQQRCDDFKVVAKASGSKIVDTDLSLDSTPVEEWPVFDYLMVELFSDMDEAEASLSNIAQYLANNRSHLLLWTDFELLETAYGLLPADRSHYMVNASDVEAMPILTGISRQMSLDQFHDRSREDEFHSLHKISDDLADFARTLARIAEQEGTLPNAVNDKPVSFRPAPANIFAPLAAPAEPVKMPTAQAMREMIKLRRLREQYFPADLFAASLEGKSVSVSSLCIAAAVPPTTALRWITLMTQQGVLVRRQDPNDARRVFIEMSANTANSLASYFQDAATRLGAPLRSPI